MQMYRDLSVERSPAQFHNDQGVRGFVRCEVFNMHISSWKNVFYSGFEHAPGFGMKSMHVFA